METPPTQSRQKRSHLRSRKPMRHIVEQSHQDAYRCAGLNLVGM